MKSFLRSAAATGVAAATLATGLSSGPVAATAAPASSGKANTTASGGLFFRLGSQWWSLADTSQPVNNQKYMVPASSRADAVAKAKPVSLPGTNWAEIALPGRTGCLQFQQTGLDWANVTTCQGGDSEKFAINNGRLIPKSKPGVYLTGVRDLQSTGQGFLVFASTGDPITVNPPTENGGVAAQPGASTALKRGEGVRVPFGLKSTATYNDLEGDVELTAPAGSKFDTGQDVTGEYTTNGTAWYSSGGLRLTNVQITDNGTKLKGKLPTGADFGHQENNWQLRWKVAVTANADTGPGNSNLGFTFNGKTELGSFSLSGNTSTTLTGNPTVPGGGVLAQPGSSTALQREQSKRVPFGVRSTAYYNELSGRVELTAPAGSKFDAGQTVTGAWFNGEVWRDSDGLRLSDVKISDQGTKLTGSLPDIGAQDVDFQLRWHAAVTANADASAGNGSLGFRLEGNTNIGAFNVSGITPTTLSGNPVTTGQISQWATGPYTLPAGKTTRVEFGTTFDGERKDWGGDIDVAAPAGTTFPRNLRTIRGFGSDDGGRTFYHDSRLDLRISEHSDDWSEVRGEYDYSDVVALSGAIIKYRVNVEVPSDAATSEEYLRFDYSGLDSTGSGAGLMLRNKRVPVTIQASAPIEAEVAFTSPEAGATVEVKRPTFTGTGEDGATVELKDGNTLIGSGTVTGGQWSITANRDLSDGPHTVTATQTTPNGASNASVTFTVSTAAPVTPLTAVAAFDAQDETKPAVVSGVATVGSTVVVRDAEDREVGKAVVGQSGSYRITVPGSFAHDGVNEFTVVQRIEGADRDSVGVSLDYGTAPAPVITSPVQNGEIANGSLHFTGTGASGAKLELRGTVSSLGTTKVVDGAWTVDVARTLKPGSYQLFAKQTSKGGVVKQAEVLVKVTALSPLTAEGRFDADVTKPATISGTARVGATVEIVENREVIKTLQAVNGTYSATIPATVAGVRTFTVTQTLGEDSTSQQVTLDYGTTGVEILTPTEGERVPADQLTFTGTAASNALVTVGGTVREVGRTTASAGGEWTLPVEGLRPGTYMLYAKQTTKGGLVSEKVWRYLVLTQ